jgi:hypothetical protein
MEQTARSPILAVDLADTKLQGDHPVLIPEFEAIAHLDGNDTECRPLESFLTVSRSYQLEWQGIGLDIASAKLFHPFQRIRVDIMQANTAPLKDFAPEQVAHCPEAKVSAPRADQYHFLFHTSKPPFLLIL